MPCLSPDDREAFTYIHTLYDDVTGLALPNPLNLNRDWYEGLSQRGGAGPRHEG